MALLAALAALLVLTRAGFLGGDVPDDQIGRDSRQRLERVLRDAERVPVEPRGSGGRP